MKITSEYATDIIEKLVQKQKLCCVMSVDTLVFKVKRIFTPGRLSPELLDKF